MEETQFGNLFSFSWQDSYKISSVLGAHLGFLGIGSLVLFLKYVYLGGLYDTLASGGGDVRLVKGTSISLNPLIIGKYLVRSFFGNEGWIVSLNNLEDFTRGHF